MVQKFIRTCFNKCLRIFNSGSVLGKTIKTRFIQPIILCLCLSAAFFFAFSLSGGAYADVLTKTTARIENRSFTQSNSPISPLALVEQKAVESKEQADNSVAEGVFHRASDKTFPLTSGKQANQTSLVLVGVVLVALTGVVGLAISRKES